MTPDTQPIAGVELEFDSEFQEIQFELGEIHGLLAEAMFKLARRGLLPHLQDALSTGQKWLSEEAGRRLRETP